MAHTWIDGEVINAQKLNDYAEEIVAGVSPTVSTSKSGRTTTITITDIEGTHTATVDDGTNGTNGTNGVDGVSPTVSTSKSGRTTTIAITDKTGTHTATIDDGTNGTNGTDGISPTVSISKVGKTTTITITDKDGVHTATIQDGNDGTGTGDMLKATYDPDNKASQIATETELTTHTGDATIHTTSSEKTTWNSKYSKPSTGIPDTDIQNASVWNGKENAGYITIGGTAYQVRTGTSGASGYITIETE